MDDALRLDIRRKLAAIRDAAYTTGIGATGHRPAPTTLYVHITDQTLLDGKGTTRVEHFGLVYTSHLEELLGHGHIVIKPVIDLKEQINVNAYEIPTRIREHIKLTHPVEQFPYGPAETTNSTDLDHIKPYNHKTTPTPQTKSTTEPTATASTHPPNNPSGPTETADTGPPGGQTSTTNLAPLRRYSHRVKTHGRWRVERQHDGALHWTTRHGFQFRVDHTGTHRIHPEQDQDPDQ
jgi:hypothetical protein